jgi:mono/diheme cytochrome c family protein
VGSADADGIVAVAVIKVLAAALIGTVVGIAVMVIVIAVSTSSNDNSSSLGLSLSQPVATTPASSQPSSGGGTSSGGGDSALIAQGKTLFSSNGCSGCHTLAAAGASGTIGPDLDKQLVSDAQAAGMPLPAFVKQSIVDPDAYIAKGFSKGIMPTSFSSLSPQDIDALVALITSGKS